MFKDGTHDGEAERKRRNRRKSIERKRKSDLVPCEHCGRLHKPGLMKDRYCSVTCAQNAIQKRKASE